MSIALLTLIFHPLFILWFNKKKSQQASLPKQNNLRLVGSFVCVLTLKVDIKLEKLSGMMHA
jgi:hypothetical protein